MRLCVPCILLTLFACAVCSTLAQVSAALDEAADARKAAEAAVKDALAAAKEAEAAYKQKVGAR